MIKLTYTPSISHYDEDEWADWLIENVNAINKSDLSEDEKRKLYCEIVRKLTDCGYDIRDWED